MQNGSAIVIFGPIILNLSFLLGQLVMKQKSILRGILRVGEKAVVVIGMMNGKFVHLLML